MGRVATTILSRLPSVYDRDPQRSLALRVRHADIASWSIEGYELVLSTPNRIDSWDLRNYSIGALANAIAADGYDIAYRNTDIDHLDATLLMEGSGVESQTNGDHIYAHGALLRAVLDAIGQSGEEAKAAIMIALGQLILPSATVEWADLFGEIFGIARFSGESDKDYTARIIEEVLRKRSNPASILANIERVTGVQLDMREPWKEIFALSTHAMSAGFHLQGAPIYEYHRIQLISHAGGVDWDAVMREAEADRPAGTLYLGSATHPMPFETVIDPPEINLSRRDRWAQVVPLKPAARLSADMFLSDYRPTPFVGFSVVLTRPVDNAGLRGPYGETAADNGWTGEWDYRTWNPLTAPAHELYPPKEYTT